MRKKRSKLQGVSRLRESGELTRGATSSTFRVCSHEMQISLVMRITPALLDRNWFCFITDISRLNMPRQSWRKSRKKSKKRGMPRSRRLELRRAKRLLQSRRNSFKSLSWVFTKSNRKDSRNSFRRLSNQSTIQMSSSLIFNWWWRNSKSRMRRRKSKSWLSS